MSENTPENGTQNGPATTPAAAELQEKLQAAEKERIEFLEKKMQRKDEVLAELMSEHIALKKELGEL